MKLKIENFWLKLEYEGYLFEREYDFPTQKEVYAFIEGIKSQLYSNSPHMYFEKFEFIPYHFFEFMTADKTGYECEAYMYGLHEARGIYGFKVRR